MKTVPLSDYEQQLLNQRGIVETVIGHLKHHYQIWHTRHRSILNAMPYLVSALAAYAIEPLKISAIKRLFNDLKPETRVYLKYDFFSSCLLISQ